jgi:hypothetical protein
MSYTAVVGHHTGPPRIHPNQQVQTEQVTHREHRTPTTVKQNILAQSLEKSTPRGADQAARTAALNRRRARGRSRCRGRRRIRGRGCRRRAPPPRGLSQLERFANIHMSRLEPVYSHPLRPAPHIHNKVLRPTLQDAEGPIVGGPQRGTVAIVADEDVLGRR